MSEVRSELLWICLGLPDPAKHLRMCFYLPLRVRRALELTVFCFFIFSVEKKFHMQGMNFLSNNFLFVYWGGRVCAQTEAQALMCVCVYFNCFKKETPREVHVEQGRTKFNM